MPCLISIYSQFEKESIPVECVLSAFKPSVIQYREGPRSDVQWVPYLTLPGRCTLPCDLSHDAFDVTYHPLLRGQTDTCENISFPQLRLWAVTIVATVLSTKNVNVLISSRYRFAQRVTISGTRGEFTLEIPTKGNSACDKMIFGITRFSSTYNSEYMRESDHCEILETLPDEDSCYIRCSPGGAPLTVL